MQDNPDQSVPPEGDSKDVHGSCTEHQLCQQTERLKALQTTIANLESQINAMQSQLREATSQLRSSNNPSQTVQNHIRLLHDYNEIRDIGQGLLGLIADKRGVRYGDVLKEFGLEADD